MKKIIFAALGLCCIMAVSCKKDQQPTTVNQLFIGASIGNINWTAQPVTSRTPGDSLKVTSYDPSDNSTLVFKMAFKGAGNYTLGAGDATFTTSDGSTTVYQLDATQTNTINIAQYSVGLNYANGSFQLNFVKVPGSNAAGNTLSLTNGRFWFVLPQN
jgi:hypothetical protein